MPSRLTEFDQWMLSNVDYPVWNANNIYREMHKYIYIYIYKYTVDVNKHNMYMYILYTTLYSFDVHIIHPRK